MKGIPASKGITDPPLDIRVERRLQGSVVYHVALDRHARGASDRMHIKLKDQNATLGDISATSGGTIIERKRPNSRQIIVDVQFDSNPGAIFYDLWVVRGKEKCLAYGEGAIDKPGCVEMIVGTNPPPKIIVP